MDFVQLIQRSTTLKVVVAALAALAVIIGVLIVRGLLIQQGATPERAEIPTSSTSKPLKARQELLEELSARPTRVIDNDTKREILRSVGAQSTEEDTRTREDKLRVLQQLSGSE